MKRLLKHWVWQKISLETVGIGLIMAYHFVDLDSRTPPIFTIFMNPRLDRFLIILGFSTFISYLFKHSRLINFWRLLNVSLLSGVWLALCVSFLVSDMMPPTSISPATLFSFFVWVDIAYHAWIEPLRTARKEGDADAARH